jgi:hypothetical protein
MVGQASSVCGFAETMCWACLCVQAFCGCKVLILNVEFLYVLRIGVRVYS